MTKYRKLLLSGIILFNSCNQRPDPERRIAATNISIPKDYQVLSFESDWGIGETTESYSLLVSRQDFDKVAKEIRQRKSFQQFSKRKSPKYLYHDNLNLEAPAETACWYDGRYFYQVYQPDPGVIITIELKEDNIMHIDYNDL